jgi:hypothetical protein
MQGPRTENEEGAQNRAEGAGVPLGAEYNTKQTRAEFLERREANGRIVVYERIGNPDCVIVARR